MRLATLSPRSSICCMQKLTSNIIITFLSFQGVKIVFKVGLALLKYCHDDLVSIKWSCVFLWLKQISTHCLFSVCLSGEVTFWETDTCPEKLLWGCNESWHVIAAGLFYQGSLPSSVFQLISICLLSVNIKVLKFMLHYWLPLNSYLLIQAHMFLLL